VLEGRHWTAPSAPRLWIRSPCNRGVKIDGIDQKIIDALRAEARVPLAVLADRIGLSRQAVRHASTDSKR
jgi:hypothetical protein